MSEDLPSPFEWSSQVFKQHRRKKGAVPYWTAPASSASFVDYGTVMVLFTLTAPAEEVPFTMKTHEPAGTEAPGKVSFTPFWDTPAFSVPIETGILVVVLTAFNVDDVNEMPVTVVVPAFRTLNVTVTTLLLLLTVRVATI